MTNNDRLHEKLLEDVRRTVAEYNLACNSAFSTPEHLEALGAKADEAADALITYEDTDK